MSKEIIEKVKKVLQESNGCALTCAQIAKKLGIDTPRLATLMFAATKEGIFQRDRIPDSRNVAVWHYQLKDFETKKQRHKRETKQEISKNNKERADSVELLDEMMRMFDRLKSAKCADVLIANINGIRYLSKKLSVRIEKGTL